ncbi:Coenzyme F420 hydrogenase/dehydrogenase, beta subunit C-terminal domain [Pseudarthrobacter phenanthrenivorans]|uniref:4Fe-4S ferredoxin-type domain-containing protein n=1 Tax=Pseudarthrobacter phenanthrenivorans TaxID=361575 RepID=A0A0B4DRW8_PSEPS|nr:hypothetical protein RM50_01865 [Pseudarthrobacter phenanthrenivorans]
MKTPKRLASFDELVSAVVESGNCSGCGLCTIIDPGLAMELNEEGFNRPVRRLPISPKYDERASNEFRASCPGSLVMRPPQREVASKDSALGGAVSSWQAWAVDPQVRFQGSSGGVLTAIAAWLLESGRATRLLGAAADTGSPRRTVPVELHRNADYLSQSGSRYAPVSVLSAKSALSPATVVVGKPCEASGLRQLMRYRDAESLPVILSFFCAGVPSQFATDRLLAELGIPPESPLRSLRYRGHGWPGEFHAETVEGLEGSASYDESWGRQLGPSMQWRCKVCPDGVGESADIVAGDYWKTDAKGYPIFTDSSGVSALIARTKRGHDIVLEALGAGVIHAEPLELKDISAIQPYQVERRATLLARLAGRRLAGWDVPRYKGFGLMQQTFKNPIRSLRYAYGSYRRSKAQRASQ